jgi:hypothetical protein
MSGGTKAEISEAPEVKGTCQYPFNRSNFAMNTAGPFVKIDYFDYESNINWFILTTGHQLLEESPLPVPV